MRSLTWKLYGMRGVGLKKALVDLKLTGVAKGEEVSNVGDVDKHVTTEGNRTGCLVVESGASSAVQCMACMVMARARSMRLLASIWLLG